MYICVFVQICIALSQNKLTCNVKCDVIFTAKCVYVYVFNNRI